MYSKLKQLRNAVPLWLVSAISIAGTIGVSFLMMEYLLIDMYGLGGYFDTAITKSVVLNFLTIGMLWCVFLILTNRVWTANLLCSCTSGILAVINYYVVTLHGMPLSFLLLRNFKTAMNVISSYSITVDRKVACLLFLLACAVVLALLTKWFGADRRKKMPWKTILIRDLVLALACVLVFRVGYLGENPIKPKKTIGWGWQEAYCRHGYLPCTIETFFQSISAIDAPDGYTQEAVDSLEIADQSKEPSSTPDVILILNESFSDLRQLMDIETDVPFLENIDSMDNLLMGYAISPSAGGGTNSSEYEILSSNSLQLLPGVTPFNTLNLVDASSIVSNLNALGYYTLGSHSEDATNYSRITGYHDLQFQQIHFREDFLDFTYHEDRPYASDTSLYANLFRWYEEAPTDSPRFLYMLTIQNHGDYKKSDDKYDLVHVTNDLGDSASLVNEYLTLISQTDQAFAELTEYFSQVDRPVIVCMLGDHNPSFVKTLVQGEDSAETNLLQRKVPLLIWANFPLEQQDLGTMSMNYVVPTLLDIAGIQLNPYYSYLLQLKEQVPILTAYGDYYDAKGNRYTYDSDEGAPYETAVDNYFYMEYENILGKRNQDLFQPYS